MSADLTVIVPSLRADVLGARAFRVSRSWFARGIEDGNVSINGQPAGKSAQAGPGDLIHAHGLGSFRIVSVDGETRKGNLRVTISVDRQR